MPSPKVVIVGGGFAGLNAARAFKRDDVSVTLIDRRNHHLFQPLLYQVATAALNPADIAYPIRGVFRRYKNVQVLLGDVVEVDTDGKGSDGKAVVLRDGSRIPYDYLLLATGATHSYFGRDEWAEWAPGLKTLEDAVEIRRRVLLAYEAAEREVDPVTQRSWLTFVVVGGGPTGVELAGALAEIGRHTMAKDFRHFDPKSLRVLLIEGRDRVLPPYTEDLSAKAQTQLEKLGVEVRTGQQVTLVDAEGVKLGEQRIHAHTVLWAAGVAASPLGKALGAPVDRAGRVEVLPDLSIPGHPEVFVLGDMACVKSGDSAVPGVAPAAIQMGNHAARNVRALIKGDSAEPFSYKDKGSLATIGRAAAVAHVGKWKCSGFFAWIMWWLIHVFFLIGFRNRLFVLIGWAWSYVTFQRGARLITGTPRTGAGDPAVR